MKTNQNAQNNDIDWISQQIGHRAGNIFLTRQLWCSGAVLVVLNQVLRGDLTQDLAIRMAAGLGKGIGASGCICGGLSGGTLALGLFLGNGRLAPAGDPIVLKAAQQLHDKFKTDFGSTCCRVLMNKNKQDTKVQYRRCSRQTAKTAEHAAALILKHRPELIRQVDWDYLNKNEGQLRARMNIAANRLKSD